MAPKHRWTRTQLRALGTAYDGVLAQLWGLHEEDVRAKRHERGIPAWRVTAARREEVDELIGKLADVEIAERCHVSAALVYRRRMALSEAKGELIESPRAARKVHTLAEAQAAAAERGGVCLSRKAGGQLRWRCEQGHVFEATAHRVIRRRQWCGRCSGQVKD